MAEQQLRPKAAVIGCFTCFVLILAPNAPPHPSPIHGCCRGRPQTARRGWPFWGRPCLQVARCAASKSYLAPAVKCKVEAFCFSVSRRADILPYYLPGDVCVFSGRESRVAIIVHSTVSYNSREEASLSNVAAKLCKCGVRIWASSSSCSAAPTLPRSHASDDSTTALIAELENNLRV